MGENPKSLKQKAQWGDHWAFRETFRWSQKNSFFHSSYTHTLLYKQGVCQLLASSNSLFSGPENNYR